MEFHGRRALAPDPHGQVSGPRVRTVARRVPHILDFVADGRRDASAGRRRLRSAVIAERHSRTPRGCGRHGMPVRRRTWSWIREPPQRRETRVSRSRRPRIVPKILILFHHSEQEPGRRRLEAPVSGAIHLQDIRQVARDKDEEHGQQRDRDEHFDQRLTAMWRTPCFRQAWDLRNAHQISVEQEKTPPLNLKNTIPNSPVQ